MINIECFPPMNFTQQRWPSVVAQQIRVGDFIRAHSGACLVVSKITHSSVRTKKQGDAGEIWVEVPVLMVELEEK